MTTSERPSSADSSLRRKELAAAIRGPLPRIPVTRRALYQQMRERGLGHDEASLMAEAFGQQETEQERAARKRRERRDARRAEKVRAKYEQLREAAVRHELAEQIAEALVD